MKLDSVLSLLSEYTHEEIRMNPHPPEHAVLREQTEKIIQKTFLTACLRQRPNIPLMKKEIRPITI